ncbi:MAG: ubiquinol-cytochrome c reductase iron-sulfur subunit [Rhodospirillaceae bacterium]|nr:ubiquinol-cytochrome c reductase iron-sulfur subunit [Rhodospirillaceae bacterium]
MAESHAGANRRDFIQVASTTMGVVGAACVAWPLIDQMNPAADTLALLTTEFDISGVEEGMSVTIVWRGKPVFVRHRTEKEVEEARSVDLDDLPDPEVDADRTTNPKFLVMVGVCTHLGCVPLGQKATDPKGEWGGWFCPCHGSHYDTSGRIRKGPAPSNLSVPPHEYISDTVIRIG